jgi:hypothetical protein
LNLLQDILIYIRRILKTPSNTSISDNLLIDYVNRFWIMDVSARLQLFDLKTKYQFQTVPGFDQYNMPLYDLQFEPGGQEIGMYPVYQNFVDSAYIGGVRCQLETQKQNFYGNWDNFVQSFTQVATGDGTNANYTFTIPFLSGVPQVPLNPPIQGILRGHVDMAGIIATGNNVDPPLAEPFPLTVLNTNIPSTSIYPAVYITATDEDGSNLVVQDSGQFISGNLNYGLLMVPGTAPFGYSPCSGGYSTTLNTINYLTGEVNVTFPGIVPAGAQINFQCYFFNTGLPRSVLFYNNTITLRSPPDRQYLVELDAFLTPAAFLNTSQAIPFGYMAEYIARGAARKILSDTGDWEQFDRYEPLFMEQENLVHIRSQRQWTATRVQTIYSGGYGQGNGNNNGGNGYL